MSKYDLEVFAVFKKLAGKKFKEVLATAEQLEASGKQPERALADALDLYGLGGAVND